MERLPRPTKYKNIFNTKKYECIEIRKLNRRYLLSKLAKYNRELKLAQTNRDYPLIHSLQYKTTLLREVINLYTHPLDN
jgi:hypothetical protein